MGMSKLLILGNVLTARGNESVIFTGARIKREREGKIGDFIFAVSTNCVNNSLPIHLYSPPALRNNTTLRTNTSDEQLGARCPKKGGSCKAPARACQGCSLR